ncbi:MAG: transposase family protein [Candidatus Thiodiazotropha sp.]
MLSFEFGVHQSTISRLFAETIGIMFVRLKPFILWPEKQLQDNANAIS